MTEGTVNLESCFARLSVGLPHLESAEQRVGAMLYRELARGKPVRRERVAEILGVPTREIVSLLERGGLASLTLYDDARRIIGFGGLSVTETVHRFNVDGQSLFTWCAWDGLFIPGMLGKGAEIVSRCPQTGRTERHAETFVLSMDDGGWLGADVQRHTLRHCLA